MPRNLGRNMLQRLGMVLALSLGTAASVLGCDGSPLILDLNGDGIQTTSTTYPVQFDINGNGTIETIAWTNPDTQEGILWLDRNRNGSVDNGQELFGDSTPLADGTRPEPIPATPVAAWLSSSARASLVVTSGTVEHHTDNYLMTTGMAGSPGRALPR